MAVVAGGRRFAHCQWLRADHALQALLGLERFPGDDTKDAAGRRLIEVPGYTFRVWVTNRSQGALELWRDYNGQATVEQRIEELKHDLAAQSYSPRTARSFEGLPSPSAE